MKNPLFPWTFSHLIFLVTIKIKYFNLLILSIFVILTSCFPLNVLGRDIEFNIELTNKENIIKDNNPSNIPFNSDKNHNQYVDVENLTSLEHPVSPVNYDNTETNNNALIEKEVLINGVPIKVNVNGTFNTPEDVTTLHLKDLDETTKREILWIATANLGFEKDLGLTRLFANGGLAITHFFDSIKSENFNLDGSKRIPLNAYFQTDTIQPGVVVDVGIKIPLDGNIFKNDGPILEIKWTYAKFEDNFNFSNSNCRTMISHTFCNTDDNTGTLHLTINTPLQ